MFNCLSLATSSLCHKGCSLSQSVLLEMTAYSFFNSKLQRSEHEHTIDTYLKITQLLNQRETIMKYCNMHFDERKQRCHLHVLSFLLLSFMLLTVNRIEINQVAIQTAVAALISFQRLSFLMEF